MVLMAFLWELISQFNLDRWTVGFWTVESIERKNAENVSHEMDIICDAFGFHLVVDLLP